VIQRPLELLILVAILVALAAILVRRGGRSPFTQILAALLVAAGAVVGVLTQQMDLVPDEIEGPLAVLALVALVAAIIGYRARRGSGRGGRT
jgi:uncharacterized membrane protein YoaK (UPF0700 family)